jgi:hypothetical protein
MNRTAKTAAVVTVASMFTLAQGHGCGLFNDLAPSTIAATAATANCGAFRLQVRLGLSAPMVVACRAQ